MLILYTIALPISKRPKDQNTHTHTHTLEIAVVLEVGIAIATLLKLVGIVPLL